MLDADTPLKNIPRFSQSHLEKLAKFKISTLENFLYHFPFRYEDYSVITPIGELSSDQTATVIGAIATIKTVRVWKRKMTITEIVLTDDSDSIKASWFNQPYLGDQLSIGKEIRLSGKVYVKKNTLYFSNPAWEFSRREPTNTGRLVPIYPETEGLTSRWIRWQMTNIFKIGFQINDPIPEKILSRLKLPSLEKSLRFIHFPRNENQYLLARKRFAFQEMFFLQLQNFQIKIQRQQEKAARIPLDEKLVGKFIASLPFTLTNAQKKASLEILEDLEKSAPMNRLLNGDVGAGKTVVAAIAALQTASAGYQTAILAPTEILARQHYKNFRSLLENYGFKISLITGKTKISNHSPEKTPKKNDLRNLVPLTHSSDIAIGTHALIQKKITFKNLALIVIDEQHRFGVAQRAYLQQKIKTLNDGIKNKVPHLLTMTATPIPRTLALAFFGNLDVSLLDEMPKNRKKIITRKASPKQREEVYSFVRQEILAGRQAFVILPLVEESQALAEVKAAVSEHKNLSEKIFPDLKIGLLHGKLKPEEKDRVMRDFKDKKIDILAATAVVEVGIDIPNATIMLIEDADRFGLSQLHQFRGRVGRGEHQSYCYLLSQKYSSEAKKRLQALVDNDNGFQIAEKDLELRGPGEFFGVRQSGLPDVAMENLTNLRLVKISQDEALQILRQDPDLKKNPLLKKALSKFEKNIHLE